MGFFSGRLTCLRFQYTGPSPRQFSDKQLAQLETHVFGSSRPVTADGTTTGWTAADHILDTRFELAKNIVNDTLHFALRVDTQKVPSDLLRAYTQVELETLAAQNPSGRPSTRQKREARQLAQERLDAEAHDGRYVRRKAFPILWDALSNEVLFGATSITALDHFLSLFQQTFRHGLEFLGAGRQAYLQAEARQQRRAADDAALSPYVPGGTGEQVAWLPDETNRDFLGNEFLLWLWYVLENESDAVALADKSEVTVMLTRTLALECPRGQTGRETIASDSPTRLPEARRAIQAGKLPRKVGMNLVRHEQQYELTLQAESLAIAGARLPAPEGEDDRARLEERVTQVRHLLETLDLLYDAFGNHRLGPNWPGELAKIQAWLARDDRRRRSAAG
jgi:hypothetical protein